jgi:hypothetical protein
MPSDAKKITFSAKGLGEGLDPDAGTAAIVVKVETSKMNTSARYKARLDLGIAMFFSFLFHQKIYNGLCG